MKTINFLFIFLCIIYASSYSQTDNTFAIRPYIQLESGYVMAGGNFDGKSYFTTDAAIILVPDINNGFAYGLQFGIVTNNFSLDFDYRISIHDAIHHVEGTNELITVNNVKFLGFSIYLNDTQHKIRPFVSFDLSGTWMRLRNGAYGINEYSDETDIARFGGIGTGLGAGLEFTIGENFSLKMTAVPSYLAITDVKGITKKYWEVSKFHGYKLDTFLAVCYKFKKH